MLEIHELTKRYERKAAIDQISFSLKKGEIFGLLGPNGAGKTTLIRIINKIIEPDSGTIRFNGDLLQQKHLAHIGYLPEERGLYKQMTVEAHAHFLGALRGMTKTEINTALDYWLNKFNCADWRKKRIQELSKGMAQKIQFICAVLHEPDLLILDEPFSGFDPVNVELIKAELQEMKLKGKTILISTHNMRSVE
uniref:ABC transporter ATP-binding protein n=1 Tax=Fluviicola sp. TaxID=1917219 RepID=UPI002617AB7E